MENYNFCAISICSRAEHLAKPARNFFALGSFLNRKEALESRASELSNVFFRVKIGAVSTMIRSREVGPQISAARTPLAGRSP